MTARTEIGRQLMLADQILSFKIFEGLSFSFGDT